MLDEPAKPDIGYRQYPTEANARIRFTKRAQQSGFTLKEIAELSALDSDHCEDVRKLAEQKCDQNDKQIQDLSTLRYVVDNLVKGSRNKPSTEHCSLIDTLSNQSDSKS